ncbi:MAG: hypothetical protein METHAR1v1_1780008 [Methanothrix sp.]|nr:MAG: hypothetical protein METHAR1v1_1780008 [Methanothrix sp.]
MSGLDHANSCHGFPFVSNDWVGDYKSIAVKIPISKRKVRNVGHTIVLIENVKGKPLREC